MLPATPPSSISAVVDIGSNSVRLVLYRVRRHYAQPIFNEKVTCQLSTNLTTGGALDETAKDKARRAIQRFRQVIDVRNPDHIIAVATAAIRVAGDGRAFAAELETMLGHPINILSGKQEAIHAAHGVALSTYQPHGLVVDLGGGSMELALIEQNGAITPLHSFPYGGLYFAQHLEKHGHSGFTRWMNELLSPVDIPAVPAIYAVGGSFRAVARYHMKSTGYPLHIIHDYELPGNKLTGIISDIAALTRTNERIIGVSRKRTPMVHPAARILQILLRRCHADKVQFSSAGIREGALREQLLHEQYDPLLTMLRAFSGVVTDDNYRAALRCWISRYLSLSPLQMRLVHAFTLASDRAMTMHPDYRADYAFEQMIATPSNGLSHREHVTLALMLYHRYRDKNKCTHPALSLLSDDDQQFAWGVGQLARLAYRISAGCSTLLERAQLSFAEDGAITLKLDGEVVSTFNETAENRWDGLGRAINACSS